MAAAEASRTAGWRAGWCGTVRRWRGAAVSPRMGCRWVEGTGVAGHPPGGYGAQAVQVVPGRPGLVPGTEGRVLGAYREPAGWARPGSAAVVAEPPPGESGVPGQHVLGVVPQESVDHGVLPQSWAALSHGFNLANPS